MDPVCAFTLLTLNALADRIAVRWAAKPSARQAAGRCRRTSGLRPVGQRIDPAAGAGGRGERACPDAGSFIADAKARPGRLNVGHSGNGTITHLAAEALKLQAGIDFLTVPYRGAAPMLTDLIGGRIDAAMDNIAGSIEHIRSGRLHALAVTTSTRSETLPSTPALAEAVPGYEAYAIAGFAAPAGTPADVIRKLNAEINAGLADAVLKERLSTLGVTLLPGTPADFAKRIALETEKLARVIKLVGIRPN